MLRISKLTDYGTLILVHLAGYEKGRLAPATDVAAGTHLSLPTVQKVLKTLAQSGLVESARGAEGGYRLAIFAIDEVVFRPALESDCKVGSAWQKISTAIRSAMEEIRLTDLYRPPAEFPLRYTILSKSGHNADPVK